MHADFVVYLLHTTSGVTLEEGAKRILIFRSSDILRVHAWVFYLERKKYSEGGTCIVLVIGKVRHSYSTNETPSTLGPDSLQ